LRQHASPQHAFLRPDIVHVFSAIVSVNERTA
jgi:hypothetical protein